MTVSGNRIPIPPPLPKPLQKPVGLRPTFVGAWRGIWLFTWRPQLTLQRLPVHLLGLLVLPILVYLTVPSPARWSGHRAPLVNFGGQVNEFSRRLARSGQPLKPEQREQLLQFFREESAQIGRAH